MTDFEVGQRVVTPHGEGTVDNVEQCNDSAFRVRMVTTGRFGVKLDNNPLPGLKDGIAYYWPNELEQKP